MFRYVFVVLAVAASGLAAEGSLNGVISEELSARIRGVSPNEFIRVNVILKEQLDPRVLEQEVRGKSQRDARGIVVQRLKTWAQNTQAGLLRGVAEEEGRGNVRRVRSLWITNAVNLEARAGAIPGIALLPDVQRVECDLRRFSLQVGGARTGPTQRPGETNPYGALTDTAWGVSKLRAPSAWRLGYRGSGVVIAHLDTGIDSSHVDLRGQLWHNTGEVPNNGRDDDDNGYVDDYIGYDFVAHDPNPNDADDHGTFTAGIMCGSGRGGSLTGIAPDAKVMVLKMMGPAGESYLSSAWEAMQYAIANGADVINMSFGDPEPDRGTWRLNCKYCDVAGLTIAKSAGNRQGNGVPPHNQITTPGDVPNPLAPSYPNCVVTVGGTTADDALYESSSYGPVTWQTISPWYDYPYPPGLIKPDVAAPGVAVKSTRRGGGYLIADGTSAAAPHVAGTVALMLSKNMLLSNKQIDSILEATAIDLGPAGKDTAFGAGRIDALLAVNAVQPVRVSGNITQNTTWFRSTYVVTGNVTVNEGVTLTVEPGTIVKFSANTELVVDGTLSAQSTATDSIVFTSLRDDNHGGDTNGDSTATVPAPGDWNRIRFYTSSCNNSIMRYCKVLYGGSGNTGNIMCDENYGQPANPTIQKCRVSLSSNYGLYIENSSPRIEGDLFSMNTSASSGFPIFLAGTCSPTYPGQNTFLGNKFRGIGVGGGGKGTFTWYDAGYPYVITDNLTVNEGSVATLDTGLVIKLYAGKEFVVDGVLYAIGAPGDSTVFTSIRDDSHGGDTNGDSTATVPAPGDWNRIRFYTSSCNNSIMRYCKVLYGGSGNTGNIMCDEDYGQPANPTIQKCRVSLSSNYGLYLESSSPRLLENLVTGNSTGIYCISSCNPVIQVNSIQGNTVMGIQNVTSANLVVAENNWWGDSTGPRHSTNPGGRGDSVSDYVDFVPWLGRPPADLPDLELLPLSQTEPPRMLYVSNTSVLWGPSPTNEYPWTDKQFIGAVVRNTGNAAVRNVVVRVYANGQPIGDTLIPLMNPGDTVVVDRMWNLPGPSAENKQVELRVDPDNTILEINEDNNSASEQVSVYYAQRTQNPVRPFDLRTDAYGEFSNFVWNSYDEAWVEFQASVLESYVWYPWEKALLGLLFRLFASEYLAEGHCHGMATTSIHYFDYPSMIPPPFTSTFTVPRADAQPNINKYHVMQFFDVVYQAIFRAFISLPVEYATLRHELRDNNEPGLLFLDSHTNTCYKLLDRSDVKLAYVYEPEEQYGPGQRSIQAFMGAFDLTRETYRWYGWERIDYRAYARCPSDFPFGFPYYSFHEGPSSLLVRRPWLTLDDWARQLLQRIRERFLGTQLGEGRVLLAVACPVRGCVADQRGRRTGFFEGNLLNEIPGATLDTAWGIEAYDLPDSLSYALSTAAFDSGKMTLALLMPASDSSARLVSFDSVGVWAGTRASLSFLVSDTAFPLEVDLDGNGSIDTTIHPSFNDTLRTPPIAVKDPDGSGALPVRMLSSEIRPNPLAGRGEIRFGLPLTGTVCLSVYDISGRLVRVLVDGRLAAGMHRATWDGKDGSGRKVAAGVYTVVLDCQGERITCKLVLFSR